MCDENDNGQEGKVAPSTLDLHGKASEVLPIVKENLDSLAKVIVEPLNSYENGHHLSATDVPPAVDEVECSHVDTPMHYSTNVDVADSQQCSVVHNCENYDAVAPLDSEPDVTTCINMNISDNHGASVEPTRESVEASDSLSTENEAFSEPLLESVEGSVEPLHESVELFMDHICENVEAIISVNRKVEVSVDENEVNDNNLAASHLQYGEPAVLAKVEDIEINENKSGHAEYNQQPAVQEEFASHVSSLDGDLENKTVEPTKNDALSEENGNACSEHLFLDEYEEGCVSGTEEQKSSFMKELEKFFKERNLEFKPPKFYGEGLNCLKLWRSVIRLGGYDKVTSCKLWRHVGECFRPPKTCTTVSWTFRGFYEKALLDFEREKFPAGELNIQAPSTAEPMSVDNQSSASVRTPRDAAARARQGWHSPRLLGNGEVSDHIIKEKSAFNAQKHEKQLKSSGFLKRKKKPFEEDADTAVRPKSSQLRSLYPVVCPRSTDPEGFLLGLVTEKEGLMIGDGDTRRQFIIVVLVRSGFYMHLFDRVDVSVVDFGLPADWVKINVQKTMDCFEVYALVPGLLREEVHVQSDPAGRLVISGDPKQPDNPWGVTPFKKVIDLPLRIDPRRTSAVVTLHGQLFVRIPFERADQ